jgi:hypothetical protein
MSYEVQYPAVETGKTAHTAKNAVQAPLGDTPRHVS